MSDVEVVVGMIVVLIIFVFIAAGRGSWPPW